MEESEIMRAISKASAALSDKIEKSTEPIRNTAAYKSLAESQKICTQRDDMRVVQLEVR